MQLIFPGEFNIFLCTCVSRHAVAIQTRVRFRAKVFSIQKNFPIDLASRPFFSFLHYNNRLNLTESSRFNLNSSDAFYSRQVGSVFGQQLSWVDLWKQFSPPEMKAQSKPAHTKLALLK